jgi:hypothetical protein
MIFARTRFWRETGRAPPRWLGHKTESIYRRYAIVDAGALRDAAAKIDRAAAGTNAGTENADAPQSGIACARVARIL